MPAILLVEDDPDNRETLAGVVAIMGYEVIAAVSGEDALYASTRRSMSARDVSRRAAKAHEAQPQPIAKRIGARRRRDDL